LLTAVRRRRALPGERARRGGLRRHGGRRLRVRRRLWRRGRALAVHALWLVWGARGLGATEAHRGPNGREGRREVGGARGAVERWGRRKSEVSGRSACRPTAYRCSVRTGSACRPTALARHFERGGQLGRELLLELDAVRFEVEGQD